MDASLVFKNVFENNITFKKDYIVDKVEKIKTEKKIKENKAAQKKNKLKNLKKVY